MKEKEKEEESLQFHLQNIKKFVDAIRSFQISSNDYKKKNQNHDNSPKKDFFDELYRYMETSNVTFTKLEKDIHVDQEKHSQTTFILECFIKPTLQSLIDNFKQIDNLSKNAKDNKPHYEGGNSNDPLKKKKKKRPPPPAGLLSIAQYTDIACLMEYFLYFIIYPYYHQYSHVFSISIPVRIQQLLPKSLRGRMTPGIYLFIPLFSKNIKKEFIKSSPNDDLHKLQTSIHIFASIITQSRFRPMLLPRHLSDLYSLILLYNHFIDIQTHTCDKQIIYPNQISMENYFAPHIEGTIVAKALQSLLYSTNTHSQNTAKTNITTATKTNNRSNSAHSKQNNQNRPLWLRSKVTYWLNRLALIDLSSILYVFVHAAHYLPGATVPTAALHLSRALMNHKPSRKKVNQNTNDAITSTISKQIWNQLIYTICIRNDDNAINKSTNTNKNQHEIIKNHENNIEMCARLVIVSMIPLLSCPKSNIHSILFLPQTPNPSLPASIDPKIPPFIGIQRLKHLLPVLPPPPFRNHFCYLLLKHDILDILMEYIAHVWNDVAHVIEKREVLFVMKLILEYFMENHDQISNADTKETPESVMKKSVIYLMKAILSSLHSINENDEIISNHDKPNQYPDESESNVMVKILSQFEIRCQIAVELVKSICSYEQKDLKKIKNNLAAPLFQLLLILCYSSPKGVDHEENNQNTHSCLIGVFQSSRAQLVAMTMLPMLFEKCKLDLLLLETPTYSTLDIDEKRNDGATTIFNMVGWIIYCAAKETHSNTNDSFESHCDKSTNIDKILFQDYRQILNLWNHGIYKSGACQISTQSQLDEILENCNIGQMGVSTLLSTASICIGLLIAMLELGERKRHQDEEVMIQSFLPNLKILASLHSRSFMKNSDTNMDDDKSDSILSSRAEVAEMAAHACGLILARGVEENTNHNDALQADDDNNDINIHHSYFSQIQHAKIDLNSSMPPIRARGAVSILRLARTITEAHDASNVGHWNKNIPNQKSFVVELNSPKKSVHQISETTKEDQQFGTSRDQDIEALLAELLNVAISALSDDESYVYMAVIQALSAIADTYPKYVLPKLATALTRGKIYSEGYDEIAKRSSLLTDSQRVKTAEAITFAIRRRGEAISHYCNDLFEELLVGCKVRHFSSPENSILSQDCKRDIQKKTDLYFQHGFMSVDNDENNEIMDDDNKLEEQMFRLKTGGPIFDVEENDTVRSCCFLCLSEVLIILPTQILSSFCNPVIQLCIESLRLDRSRLIRRAASSLAGDLYRLLLRDEYIDSLSMAVEFILAKEEALFSALNQCINLCSMVEDKVFLRDEPTIARCEEALSARRKCVENGIFAAAQILAEAKKNNDDARIPQIIKSMLSDKDTTMMNNGLTKLRITDDFQFDV